MRRSPTTSLNGVRIERVSRSPTDKAALARLEADAARMLRVAVVALSPLRGRQAAARSLLRACADLAGRECSRAEAGSLCAQLAGAAWTEAARRPRPVIDIFKRLPEET